MRLSLFLLPLWLLGCAGVADRDQDGITDKIDECPLSAEDQDQFQDSDGCPDLDNDKDGVPDGKDNCPLEAEDRDGFEDANGCPDMDNDQDGISDLLDKCPFVKEDLDQFQDEDGCSELDNDLDGLQDNFDKCPSLSEDLDQYQDDDGCPDLDNDQDGIVDSLDRCPKLAETRNGKDDADGCPDAIIASLPEQMELPLSFVDSTDELTEVDRNWLAKNVAPSLMAHPEDRIYIFIFLKMTGDDENAYIEHINQRTKAVDMALQAQGVPGHQIRTRTVTVELLHAQSGSDLDYNSARKSYLKRKSQ